MPTIEIESLERLTDWHNRSTRCELNMARQFTSQIEKGLNSAPSTGWLADNFLRLHESIPKDWRQSMEVNVIGVYNTIHAATPYLRKRGHGKIIVTGSGTRYRDNIGRSDDASAKSAVWIKEPEDVVSMAP
jgi:NAD(P)-dependent dehydrogenase (short-subunit alcohol dehydrogenase family)